MSARVDRRRDANWAAAVYWPHLVRPIAIVLVRELDRILRSPSSLQQFPAGERRVLAKRP